MRLKMFNWFEQKLQTLNFLTVRCNKAKHYKLTLLTKYHILLSSFNLRNQQVLYLNILHPQGLDLKYKGENTNDAYIYASLRNVNILW